MATGGEGGYGNFAGTGGYSGQFGGYGGASAGYSGGYGNPSSYTGGTMGQTQMGMPYASQNSGASTQGYSVPQSDKAIGSSNTTAGRPKMTGIYTQQLDPIQQVLQNNLAYKYQDRIPPSSGDPYADNSNPWGDYGSPWDHLGYGDTPASDFLDHGMWGEYGQGMGTPGGSIPKGTSDRISPQASRVSPQGNQMAAMSAPMGAQALGGMAPDQMRNMMQLQQQFGGGGQFGGGQGGQQGGGQAGPGGGPGGDRGMAMRLQEHLANRGMKVRPDRPMPRGPMPQPRGPGQRPDPRVDRWGMGGNGLGLQGLMSRFA